MADIFETLKSDGRFTRLLEVIQTLKKEQTLREEGPVTFFAPVDASWDEIPEPNRSMILNDKQMLGHLFEFMQLRGQKFTIDELVEKKFLKTVEGTKIEVQKTDEGTMVEDAKVIEPDLEADNGIIHIIQGIPFATLSQAYEAYAKTKV
jgi:uncharacterized surface protein with fasciclin (FAS1) repeats